MRGLGQPVRDQCGRAFRVAIQVDHDNPGTEFGVMVEAGDPLSQKRLAFLTEDPVEAEIQIDEDAAEHGFIQYVATVPPWPDE
jgi:hypothetical protein